MCQYDSCLAFFCIYHYSVYYEIKCSLFENFTEVVLCLKWLFVALDCWAQNLDTDYIILTFKAEFVCSACSDFITSSYLNVPEAIKLHTNGFSLYYYDIHCVHCYKYKCPHLTWPQFWCHTAHTWIKTIFFMMEIVAWNIPLFNDKTENSLLGIWFWGSVSHFRSRPFVTGSYIYWIVLKGWLFPL